VVSRYESSFYYLPSRCLIWAEGRKRKEERGKALSALLVASAGSGEAEPSGMRFCASASVWGEATPLSFSALLCVLRLFVLVEVSWTWALTGPTWSISCWTLAPTLNFFYSFSPFHYVTLCKESEHRSVWKTMSPDLFFLPLFH
jgi:hypothetical protein